MLQAIVRKGQVVAEQVPAPGGGSGTVTIRVGYSCISPGTELGSVSATGTSMVRKAIQSPAKVARAVTSARSMGVQAYASMIKGTTLAGVSVGYSVAGVAVAVGRDVDDIQVGDVVAAGGAGFAVHAEVVTVPKNLVVRVPSGVSVRHASTVTLGAIALHGVRRADLRLGERCVVLGAGAIGLLATQLLRLSGVRVIAVDLDPARLSAAAAMGVEAAIDARTDDPVQRVLHMTGSLGVDAVLFAADARSAEPVSQAFQMCRRKGKVVMVGKADLHLRREDVYPKELDLITSTSYGPGRYDRTYEEGGQDYPYAYVRWTERRNMEEYMRLLASGHMEVDRLISAEYSIADVGAAFESLTGPGVRPLLVVLNYPGVPAAPDSPSAGATPMLRTGKETSRTGALRVALVGPGAFARAVHLPILADLKKEFALHAVVGRTGHAAKAVAGQYGAAYCTTSYDDILADGDVDLVAITSTHATHASFVLRALRAGKNVFVEKPLATTAAELDEIEAFFEAAAGAPTPLLMVGYNRRFSDYATAIRRHTDGRINPLFVTYRMNAGYKPRTDPIFEQGGRIIGEACHIVDLMTSLTGARLERAGHDSVRPVTDWCSTDDNRTIVLRYEDGSVCTIHYVAVGHPDLSKEYMEVHFDGKSIVLDDYRALTGFGAKVPALSSRRSEKGHRQEWEALHAALSGESHTWPIPLWDLLQTTRVTVDIASSPT